MGKPEETLKEEQRIENQRRESDQTQIGADEIRHAFDDIQQYIKRKFLLLFALALFYPYASMSSPYIALP